MMEAGGRAETEPTSGSAAGTHFVDAASVLHNNALLAFRGVVFGADDYHAYDDEYDFDGHPGGERGGGRRSRGSVTSSEDACLASLTTPLVARETLTKAYTHAAAARAGLPPAFFHSDADLLRPVGRAGGDESWRGPRGGLSMRTAGVCVVLATYLAFRWGWGWWWGWWDR